MREAGLLAETIKNAHSDEYSFMHLGQTASLQALNNSEVISGYLEHVDERHSFINPNASPARIQAQIDHRTVDEFSIDELLLSRLHELPNYRDMTNEEIHSSVFSNAKRNQRRSLQTWVNYLRSADHYPTWFKYYTYNGLAHMGVYEADRVHFGKRSSTSFAPYAPFDAAALAKVHTKINDYLDKSDVIRQSIKDWSSQEDLSALANDFFDGDEFEAYLETRRIAKESNQDFKRLGWEKPKEQSDSNRHSYFIESLKFDVLYANALAEVKGTMLDPELLKITEGEWVKYSEAQISQLEQSLSGWGTGWCIAEGMALDYLAEDGTIYVFYTYDHDKNANVPRAAVTTRHNNVGEVRGILDDQALETKLAGIVFEFLDNNPSIDAGNDLMQSLYQNARISTISAKNSRGEELNIDDLKLIYQIDGVISDFRQNFDFDVEKDEATVSPSVLEIIGTRDVETDLKVLFPDINLNEAILELTRISADLALKVIKNIDSESIDTNRLIAPMLHEERYSVVYQLIANLPENKLIDGNEISEHIFDIAKASDKELFLAIIEIIKKVEDRSLSTSFLNELTNRSLNYSFDEIIAPNIDKFSGIPSSVAIELLECGALDKYQLILNSEWQLADVSILLLEALEDYDSALDQDLLNFANWPENKYLFMPGDSSVDVCIRLLKPLREKADPVTKLYIENIIQMIIQRYTGESEEWLDDEFEDDLYDFDIDGERDIY